MLNNTPCTAKFTFERYKKKKRLSVIKLGILLPQCLYFSLKDGFLFDQINVCSRRMEKLEFKFTYLNPE